MTTNLDIIKGALKKLHVLAAGTNPSSAQASDAMDALQSLYVELIGQGSLGRLRDVLATSDYNACEFDRIQASNGITVTLPTVITPAMISPGWGCGEDLPYDYGFRACDPVSGGSSRPPVDRACVVVVQNGAATYSVFRAVTNSWVTINGLTQQSAFPFADTLVDGFKALLAERLQDDYETQIGPGTQRTANTCRWMLAAKPDSKSASVPSHYF